MMCTCPFADHLDGSWWAPTTRVCCLTWSANGHVHIITRELAHLACWDAGPRRMSLTEAAADGEWQEGGEEEDWEEGGGDDDYDEDYDETLARVADLKATPLAVGETVILLTLSLHPY